MCVSYLPWSCLLSLSNYLVVILAYCVASESKLHDCFGLLCEVLEVCFSVIRWAEYSGKIRGLGGGEGAQVSQAQDACDSEAFS